MELMRCGRNMKNQNDLSRYHTLLCFLLFAVNFFQVGQPIKNIMGLPTSRSSQPVTTTTKRRSKECSVQTTVGYRCWHETSSFISISNWLSTRARAHTLLYNKADDLTQKKESKVKGKHSFIGRKNKAKLLKDDGIIGQRIVKCAIIQSSRNKQNCSFNHDL